MDPDTRALLVAGDHDTIVEVLFRIYQMELESGLARDSANGTDMAVDKFQARQASMVSISPSKLSSKEVKPEQPISILEIRGDRRLDQTETTLEFVLVSLCQALNISTNQAAGLLTDENYYLMHACVKGVKGDFTAILKWYQLLIQTCQHLVYLAVESLPMPDENSGALNDSMILEEDTMPLFVLLGALKCGVYSDSFQVSSLAFKLFSKISSDLNNYGY